MVVALDKLKEAVDAIAEAAKKTDKAGLHNYAEKIADIGIEIVDFYQVLKEVVDGEER
jgi:hypothetical protein